MPGTLPRTASSPPAASASDELDLYLTVQRGKRPIGVNLSASNLVTEVTPGTPADGVLHVGDRLVEIDGVPLRGRPAHAILTPAPSHQFRVRRRKGEGPSC